MSRIREDYDKSRWRKVEDWVNGDRDPMDDSMEIRQPSDSGLDTDINITEESLEETTRRLNKYVNRAYNLFSIIFCFTLVFIMIWCVTYMPRFGDRDNPVNNEVSQRYIERGLEETGAVNFVTGMILDYRAFDTFGESCVLFIATICVQILLRHDDKEKDTVVNRELTRLENDRLYEPKNDPILQKVSCVLVPLIFIFGIYIILNGHLSPGGGFSGGAVIGAGLILYLNAFGFKKTERFFTDKTFRVISLSALSFYCIAKSYSFYTGANHLESGIPLGPPGAILSSGLILPLNICVGLVVACTMYAFYALFRKGGF
ncbi:MAG: hypothetical protein IKX76_02745 [Eubacterium sp.]|nr:hypothetical protein [Eubacterium sp.]